LFSFLLSSFSKRITHLQLFFLNKKKRRSQPLPNTDQLPVGLFFFLSPLFLPIPANSKLSIYSTFLIHRTLRFTPPFLPLDKADIFCGHG